MACAKDEGRAEAVPGKMVGRIAAGVVHGVGIMRRHIGASLAGFSAVALLSTVGIAPVAGRTTDATETLHVAFSTAETGFDPQAVADGYSAEICAAIFDAPYRYDYFVRPLRLIPNTAAGLPEITDEGRTYTIHIKPGIYFADDPAFEGHKRELTAADYVFSYKRILDPKLRSSFLYIFENRLLGLDPVLAKARKDGRLDYDTPIEGLQVLDRYTFRVRFVDPNYAFQYWLTTVPFAAVAPEVVKAHEDASDRDMEHPVGTGPYRLAQWRRSQQIVLDANPNFRDERYPAPPPDSPEDALIAKGLVGRRLPLTPRVDIRIVEEEQPRLLGFRAGEFDYLGLAPGSVPEVVDGGHLKPEYAMRGIVLHHGYEQALSYTFINMDDPVIGGYALAQIALRRAIAMAYDTATEIRVLEAGQGSIATQLVPPPVPGYDPAHVRDHGFDPVAARALLDHFGYRAPKGSIYRDLPDGRPLTLTMGTTPDSASRQYDELWKRCLDAIGIRVKFLIQSWPDLQKMATAGKLQMWQLGMGAPTPDADIFYTMLYSGSAGLFNLSRFHLPAYDRAYEASARLPDGPARYAEFRRMDALVDAYAPLILNRYPYYNVLTQPWLKGFKMNIFAQDKWAYYAVEGRPGSRRAK